VAGLTWRRCLSTSGVTITSPVWVRRSSSSGRKGCQRCGPMWPVASERSWAAVATAGPYWRGRPARGRLTTGPGVRRSRRMAALRWSPATATTSFSNRCFSARDAYR
jgi:hypothetical protein